MKHLSNNDFNQNLLANVPTPTQDGDAANKVYVDDRVAELATDVIVDGIQEWWQYPLATYLETPDRRTVFSGISSTGEVLAMEVNHDTGNKKRVEVASVPVDDHNTPILWAAPGRRMVMMYTHRGSDSVIYYKVSDTSGDIDTLASATELTKDFGDAISYNQLFKIDSLSSASEDVFWYFNRVTAAGWNITPMTVNQSTGAVTWGTSRAIISSTSQAYLSIAEDYSSGVQKLRVSWCHNPAAASSAVRYFEINCSTGAITSPLDGSLSANVSGTNLPINEAALSPLLEGLASGFSRRMFYVRGGPALPAVAIAEWDNTTPDEAEYKVVRAVDSTATAWTVDSYGTAGPRIGYHAGANYISGMTFPYPANDESVIVARETEGYSTVEIWNRTTSAVIKTVVAHSYANRLIRPVTPVNGGPISVMFSNVSEYSPTSYRDWESDIEYSIRHTGEVAVTGGGTYSYTPYTPVLSSSGTAPSLGNGSTRLGHFQRVGDQVHYEFDITFGSSGSSNGSGTYTVSLPFTMDKTALGTTGSVGRVYIYDSSTNNRGYVDVRASNSGNELVMSYVTAYPTGLNTLVDSVTPWTWGNGDAIRGSVTYKAL